MSSSLPAGSAQRLNVLVVGYGATGEAVLGHLASPAFSSRVQSFLLVRASSLADHAKKATFDRFHAQGVTLLTGDINDDAADMTRLLRAAAIQTIVSAVGNGQHMSQIPLIEAARAAGVKHFVPSEFGFELTKVPPASSLAVVFDAKLAVQKALFDSGLDWTVVLVGAFAEFILTTPVYSLDLEAFTFSAAGSYSSLMSVTSLVDLSYLIANAVVDPQARNRVVYAGEQLSFDDIASTVEKVYGRPLRRSVVTAAEADARIRADPGDIPARFTSYVASQQGTSWPVEQTYAPQYLPQWKLSSFEQLTKKLKGSKKR